MVSELLTVRAYYVDSPDVAGKSYEKLSDELPKQVEFENGAVVGKIGWLSRGSWQDGRTAWP